MTARHNATITHPDIIALAGYRREECRALLSACDTTVAREDGQPHAEFVWRERHGRMGLALASCGQFLAWAECDESTVVDGLTQFVFHRTGRFGPVCRTVRGSVEAAREKDDQRLSQRDAT